MIALRLVHLIEGNSEKLAKGLLDKILSSERASGVRVVDRNELECGAYEVYQNLSDWLLTKTESDIELRATCDSANAAPGKAFLSTTGFG